jgi:uncharacterized protein YjbI with pentapeptide repeats
MKTQTLNMEMTMISGSYAAIEGQVFESGEVKDTTISGARLTQITFKGCTFSNVTFYGSCFEECKFIACRFENCRFLFTHMKANTFQGCTFETCELKQGGVYGNDFSICQFDSVSSDIVDISHNHIRNCFMDERTKERTLIQLAAA